MEMDRQTDILLQKLERKCSKEYGRAYKELKEMLSRYVDGWDEKKGKKTIHHYGLYERRAQEYEAMVNRGVYTAESFEAWWESQLAREDNLVALYTQMSKRLTDASIIATGYINGTLPSIYAINSNGIANEAVKSAMAQGIVGVRFDLVDEHNVRVLLTDDRQIRAVRGANLNVSKEEAWNYKHIQSEITQGLLQGDGIPKLSARLQKVVGMDRSSAIRNARTFTTNAQNVGKVDRYGELASQGCEVRKMWVSTADERTREAHIEAGETYGDEKGAIPWDEPFMVGTLEEGYEALDHPADLVHGSAHNVYNCRCTMASVYSFKNWKG